MRTTVRRIVALPLVTVFLTTPVFAGTDAARLSGGGFISDKDATNLAMLWFREMQKGRTDRALYASSYAPQITNQAVTEMSKALNQYGASPLRAEIVRTRTSSDQIFDVVKFVFARGDATSLMFGFDTHGKITGIAVEGLAGD